MIRAHVHEDRIGMTVGIFIMLYPPEGSMDGRPRILRLPVGDQKYPDWEEIPPTGVVDEPTLRLGTDEARALLDALTNHFHGAEDTRALRRDYDHERERVDTLIGHLAAIGRQLTAPDPPPPPARLEPVRGGRESNGWLA